MALYRASRRRNWVTCRQGLCGLLVGERDLGEMLVDSPQVPLVSATGSTAMGRAVAPKLAARFAGAARCLSASTQLWS